MSRKKVKPVKAWGVTINGVLTLRIADRKLPTWTTETFKEEAIRVLITPLPAARRRKPNRKKTT